MNPPVYTPQCGHQFCAPTVCRFENTEPRSFPDHREYPQPSRPDLDLDTFGRPLKPGT